MRGSTEGRYEAGIELQKKAEEFKQRRSLLSDGDALKLAMLANPDLAEQYTGYPVRRNAAEDVLIYFESDHSEPRHRTNIERLAAIVESTAKFADRSYDWSAIISRAHGHLDIVERAAREAMEKLVDEGVSREARNYVRNDRAQIERQLRVKYDDLSRTLDNPRNINERAVRLILAQRV